MILTATTETLEIETSTAGSVHVATKYLDTTATTATPGSSQVAITTATTTVAVTAPAASTQRSIQSVSVENNGTTSQDIKIKKDVSGTETVIHSFRLNPGESCNFSNSTGFIKHASDGSKMVALTTDRSAPFSANSFSVLKVGTTAEAAGVMHFLGLAAGIPGAWSPGTPGLNGRATDGTTAGDAGCIPIPNASSGTNYLTQFSVSATVACTPMLLDILWVNTGIVVTTTTAQAITPVALPARSQDGTNGGKGVMAGILVTTATTNAGAITNCKISYTNQDGVAGRTGTMASFPITAVAGTIVPFQLATGDSGVRSVQSVTLGTSLVTGAVSLILYRIPAISSQLLANTGATPAPVTSLVTLYPGVCLLLAAIPTTTTATTITALVNVEAR